MPGSRRGLAEWEQSCRVRARYRELITARLAAEDWGYLVTLTRKWETRDRRGFLRFIIASVREWFPRRVWLASVEDGELFGRVHGHLLLDGGVPLKAVERFCRWWGVDHAAVRARLFGCRTDLSREEEDAVRAAAYQEINVGYAHLRLVRGSLVDREAVAAYCVKYLRKQGDAFWGVRVSAVAPDLGREGRRCWLTDRLARAAEGPDGPEPAESGGGGSRETAVKAPFRADLGRGHTLLPPGSGGDQGFAGGGGTTS